MQKDLEKVKNNVKKDLHTIDLLDTQIVIMNFSSKGASMSKSFISGLEWG